MPYSTIAEAKDAGFPTTINKVNLTLPQINHLAKVYDGIKKAGSADEPMAVAIAQFKDAYKIEDGKWMLKEEKGEHESRWFAVAKKDQERRYEDGKIEILDEKAILDSLGSWDGKGVAINHKAIIANVHKILRTKYESPFLYMKFDDLTGGIFSDSDATGWSLKFDPKTLKYDGNRQVEGKGKNISILYYPHGPACTPEMGCYETYELEKDEFEGKTKSVAEDIKSRFEDLKNFVKVTFSKSEEKKEEGNQEENLDKKENMEDVEKLTSELQTATTELTKVKGEFETLQADRDTEVKELRKKIGEYEQEKNDAREVEMKSNWEQLKKTTIPKGLVHKEEDEKKLKAEFEQSPHEFIMKMVKFEKHEDQKEEGGEFETDPDEITKATKEMDEVAGMEVPHGN